MGVYFQSICSSSSGNCLGVWSETTRLLIDCGLSSMKRTRQAIGTLFDRSADAVLLTHTHSDHISYYPLRVLEEQGLPVYLHDDCVEQLRGKHFNGYGFAGLKLRPFRNAGFEVGDFSIQPFAVAHHPNYPTYGYRIRCQGCTMVFVTDFLDWEPVFEHFLDADFIFVESNHDLDLLRRYYNPNSRFHMPNPQTAELLVQVSKASKHGPRTVFLGHLSNQRNDPDIALGQTVGAFRDAGIQIKFDLKSAPLRQVGQIVRIA